MPIYANTLIKLMHLHREGLTISQMMVELDLSEAAVIEYLAAASLPIP